MEITERIQELKTLVATYNTESFAGFFAYFIKNGTRDSIDITLNQFESKLKDFLYLIALNVFAENKEDMEFEFSPTQIEVLAQKLNAVKAHYRVETYEDYTTDAVIHEMAFRNHFDNGVLSYVEQDLEKIRTIFLPFDDKIVNDFGFDVDFLIEVYKATELVSKIRFEQTTAFTHTPEFRTFDARIDAKERSFQDAFDLLPANIQNDYLSFHAKPHAYLLFSKEDLYHTLPKDKVDRFLQIFSCKVAPNAAFRYYTDNNPLELAPIIELSENRYLHVCQKQIPVAVHRFLYSHFVGNSDYNERIRKHREKSLEQKVSDIFRNFFPAKQSFFYKNYFAEKNAEQDLLILFKGTALIIETKASKLREPFRDIQKAVVRLKADFKEAIQYGYNQCRRVEKFFEGEHAFDIKDARNKLLYRINPNKYHSVYSIVVTLERFGSLQTDLGLFLQKDVQDNYPWSVYIDDLEIFLLTLKHHTRNPQGKFFDFLKNRSLLHSHIYAIDELDVCASYLQDPLTFAGYAKQKDRLISFSPLEQAYFDKIYHTGGLRFREEPMPDFHRYFGKNK